MNDSHNLILSVEKLKNGRVLCVGDLMLDRFIYGAVDRISPEAPIPIFRCINENVMLGGAGNVARNIAGLGGRTHFISLVGNDQAGRDLTAQIGDLGNLDARLITDSSRKTSIKTRFIASNQQMMRADDETISPVSGAVKKLILEAVELGIDDFSTVVLADYGKGVLSEGITGEIIQMARLKNIPVIVDPQGNNYDLYMGATLVTPNCKELGEAIGLPTTNTPEIINAAALLARQCGIDAILTTRSGDGMTLVRNNDNFKHYPAEAKEVFDVSGAGDTVVACIATALSAGVAMEEAIALANTAAGIVVGKVGTAVAYSKDLSAILSRQENIIGEKKLCTLVSAEKRVNSWKFSGKTVGFTNGCFDLLHPGHLALLSQAKSKCDKLVVGLNSDASIKQLKGTNRPVQNQDARASVLTSLETVDIVIVFEEDTPAKIIKSLKPDIFIKGADYKIDKIPEATIVEEYGGEIFLADLVEGYSTTLTIDKIKD